MADSAGCELPDRFFDEPKPSGLRAEDVARSVMYAVQQPPTVDIHEVLIMPTPPEDR